jgi:methionyl aminopeptidase
MTMDLQQDLTGLRQIGRIVDLALAEMQRQTQPGMTTAELDAVGAAVLDAHGANATPRRIYGFPGTTCISINDQVVHGVPGERVIQPGDLVKIDLTADRDGYVADAARFVTVPPVSPVAAQLAECAVAALRHALQVARAGNPIRRIGRAIEHEARQHGFSVVHELAGHGVGRTIHEEPIIPNFDDPTCLGRLTEGLVITIEPMIIAGGRRIRRGDDSWTVLSADGTLAIHYEQTIVITAGEPIVLTAPPDDADRQV